MTAAFFTLTDILFLVLFMRLFAREGSRSFFFNPFILWTGRITGPVGRFAADIIPGITERAASGVALVFLIAFRGALMMSAGGDGQSLAIGSTFVFHPHAGWAGAIAFSLLRFATFLAHFWGFALLATLLATPGDSRTRASQALDAFAAPLSACPLWTRALAVVAVNAILAILLRHLAIAGLPGMKPGFASLFRADTPQRLAAIYSCLAILSLADAFNFAREALLIAIFASLLAAILRNQSLGALSIEFQGLILGRFSRRKIGVGALDFSPIVFFIALGFSYGLLVAFTTMAMRHFGLVAAGALASMPY